MHGFSRSSRKGLKRPACADGVASWKSTVYALGESSQKGHHGTLSASPASGRMPLRTRERLRREVGMEC